MDRLAPPRGTSDFAPEEAETLARLTRTVEEPLARGGYLPVRTPVFERFQLLAARAGDAIRQSMFTFVSERTEYALRPEMTAPICRLVASGRLGTGPVHRIRYAGPCFRYTRLGAGRRREFTQAGAELLGVPSPAGDAEIALMAAECLDALGIGNATIRIGHIGVFGAALADLGPEERSGALLLLDDLMILTARCESYDVGGGDPEDAAEWLREVAAYVYRLQQRAGYPAEETLTPPARSDADSVPELVAKLPGVAGEATARVLATIEGVGVDLARKLVAGTRVRGEIGAVAAEGAELFGPPVRPALEELAEVFDWCGTLGVKGLKASLGVARGFEFYTGATMEILAPWLSGEPTLGGGGRYDSFVAEMGGEPTAAAGFALCIENVASALAGGSGFARAQTKVFEVLPSAYTAMERAAAAARALRAAGLAAPVPSLAGCASAPSMATVHVPESGPLVFATPAGETRCDDEAALVRTAKEYAEKEGAL